MTEQQDEKDLDDEMKQIMDKETGEKAAEPEPQPEVTPEPDPEPQVQDTSSTTEEPTPEATKETPSPAPVEDDAVRWAKEKGLTTPEAIARSYQKLEAEFHERNKKGHPGYQDGNPSPAPQVPPGWRPQGGTYPQPSYQPQGQSRDEVIKNIARKHQIDPEDAERIVPLVAEIVNATRKQDREEFERRFSEIQNKSSQSDEMFKLMKDPAYSNPIVVQEMHKVFEANPGLFGRQGAQTIAYNKALSIIALKGLQQGENRGTSPKPPVTAGGGSGNYTPGSGKLTEAVFFSKAWTEKDRERYLTTNGKMTPKR
jgi:hypothetical protein